MKRAILLWFAFALIPFRAPAAGALAARNVTVDSGKQQVSFEIVNQSAKAVRSWTLTIVSKKKGPGHPSDPYNANMLTTSEGCSRAAALAPGESCRCNASLYSGEPATVLSAEVKITAVLFEDGSAEGDVDLLDNLARVRRSIYRCLEFWIGQLGPALAAPTPPEQLQAMRKALSAPDSALPPDLRYDPTAARERQSLLFQVSSPHALAAGTVQMLKQRLNQMRAAPEAFPPRRGADLAPPAGDLLQGWRTLAGTAALRLVAVRDSSIPMNFTTFFLQNVSPKPITALAVAFGGPVGGRGHRVDCLESPVGVCVVPGASYALSQADASEHTLAINAVIFEDGTGDGVRGEIDAIRFTRLGSMLETERIRGLLDAAGTDLATLPAKLGGLPQSPEAAFPGLEQVKLPGVTLDRIRTADSASRVAFLSGVRSAREEATRRLAEFQQRAAGLEELRREFRDLSIRNHAYCDRVYAPQGL